MKKQVDDPGGPGSPASRKKNKKTVPSSFGISNVLFSCKRRISVQAIAKYSLSVRFCFKLQTSPVKCFFAVYNSRVQRAFLFKKRKAIKMQVHDAGGSVSPATRRKQKTVPSPEENEEKED